MTQSVRDKIITQIAANLAAIPALGATVYRGRQSAQMRADGSMVVVEPVSDATSIDVMAKANWQLTVALTVIARGSPPDQAADAILTAIYQKMMSDTTVSGLANDVLPQTISWDLVSADRDAVVATATFMVMYRTSINDISVS